VNKERQRAVTIDCVMAVFATPAACVCLANTSSRCLADSLTGFAVSIFRRTAWHAECSDRDVT